MKTLHRFPKPKDAGSSPAGRGGISEPKAAILSQKQGFLPLFWAENGVLAGSLNSLFFPIARTNKGTTDFFP